ncbi:aminoacyl-histidine dipeptidase [Fusobacterium nucleatum subsp. nucleatum ATCC 23726]|uniref:aminoacyl-histidine dipeptidase n=1 Tax=Fusobacterium nucleatum TaxID=851 RepID=UPI00164E0E2A|nr:aminoacyl-histidine dipeptidase [Fusobacterium nucleatum]
MMRKLENLKPERVFYYFEELSKIPRESGNEKAVSDYLIKTAKKLDLESYQDENLNVIIKKTATKGYENSKGIILQGHLDMVCEKELESKHNFKTDALNLIIEDGYLRADATTLGADNGIAVAMSLAILEDNNLEHPQIEFLGTVEEETTMKGALRLKPNLLTGKYLINVDSEAEGLLTAGSAGGRTVVIDFEEEKATFSKDKYAFFMLGVKNLIGGHSGMEIDKGRMNANKILTELLVEVKKNFEIKLCSFKGGTKENAIPRVAMVEVAVMKKDLKNFRIKLIEIMKNIIDKYILIEKNMELEMFPTDEHSKCFSDDFFNRFLAFMSEAPTGLNTWLQTYPDIVESSNNIAILRTFDNKIHIEISLRSAEPTIMDKLTTIFKNLSKRYKANFQVTKGYPEWRFKKDSHLRNTALKLYNNLFGKNMEVTVMHAGLECGVIGVNYPDLDIISIGPNIYDVHTPKEKMDIKSVERTYLYLTELLKTLK